MALLNFKSRTFKDQVRTQRRKRAVAEIRRRLWVGRYFLLKTAAIVTAAYFISKWISA